MLNKNFLVQKFTDKCICVAMKESIHHIFCCCWFSGVRGGGIVWQDLLCFAMQNMTLRSQHIADKESRHAMHLL